jgi:hypothetical protein
MELPIAWGALGHIFCMNMGLTTHVIAHRQRVGSRRIPKYACRHLPFLSLSRPQAHTLKRNSRTILDTILAYDFCLLSKIFAVRGFLMYDF